MTLADEVPALRAAALEGSDGDRTLAVEGLAALARADGGSSVPDRAATALVETLPALDDGLAADVLRTLRYVAVERPDAPVRGRLDEPVAAAVDDWDHAAHRRVCVDAGALLGAGVSMPATRETLRVALETGPPAVREHAALAFLQVADRPEALDDPAAVAEGLRAAVRGREEPLPAPGTAARTLADGRTVSEAARLLSVAA